MRGLAAFLAVGLVLLVARRTRWSRPPRAPRGHREMVLDRRQVLGLASATGCGLGLLLGGLAAGVVALAAVIAIGPCVAVARRRQERAAIASAVPDLVDLFLVSASAGRPVPASMAVVAERAPPAVRRLVADAQERFAHGLPLADCLAELGGALGPDGVPLVDALGQSASAGVPLVPLLEGVAATARDARRRRAQEAARRLPVTMLFPLVLCILPAAVLLAVVPVLLVSVSSLTP